MIDQLERQFEVHLRETDHALRQAPMRPFETVRRTHQRRSVALAFALTVSVVGVPVLFGVMAGEGPAPDDPGPIPVVSPETTQPVLADVSWTWTQLETPALGGEGSQVISAMKQTRHGLLAGGYSGDEGAVWRSADGLTWERVSDPEGAFGPAAGVFGNEGRTIVNGFAELGSRTVAVGAECGRGERELDPCVAAAWYSDDGAVWHRVAHNSDLELRDYVFFRDLEWESWHNEVPNAGMTGVAATPLGLVAVGNGVWTSSDGIDWEQGEMVGTDLFDVAAMGGRLLLVGRDDGRAAAWWSQYGRIWSATVVEASADVDSRIASTRLIGAVQPATGYAAVGLHEADYGFDVAFWTSVDGEAWDLSRIGTWGLMEDLFAVAASGDVIVAVGTEAHTGQRAAAWLSEDGGSTWTKIPNEAGLFGHYDLEAHSSAAYAAAAFDGNLIIGGHRDGDAAIWIGEPRP